MSLILASASPRRKELLEMMGVPFSVVASTADEPEYVSGPVEDYVKMLAEKKAASVFSLFPNDYVIGADTIVFCNGRILGKPQSAEKAREYLSMLQNNNHMVYTGIALIGPGFSKIDYDCASVFFTSMSEEEISMYIATNEPFDKAGGYGIQGRGGVFINKIDGNYYTVMGLPLPLLYRMMKNAGLYCGIEWIKR